MFGASVRRHEWSWSLCVIFPQSPVLVVIIPWRRFRLKQYASTWIYIVLEHYFLSILINVFQTSLLFLYKRKRVQTSGRFDASNKAHRTRFRRNNRWTRLQTYLRNTSFIPSFDENIFYRSRLIRIRIVTKCSTTTANLATLAVKQVRYGHVRYQRSLLTIQPFCCNSFIFVLRLFVRTVFFLVRCQHGNNGLFTRYFVLDLMIILC